MQAVIFDLDGTLCDSREAMFWQFEELTRQYNGKAAGRQEIAAAAHGTSAAMLRALIPDTDVPIEELLRRHAELRAESMQMVHSYPGVNELLPILHRVGVRVAALTAGGHQSLEALRQAGIYEHFDMIVTAEDVCAPKPDPEGLFKILEHFGVEPAEAIMVGDTPADIATGKRAKVAKTIGVTHGFGTTEELRMATPDHIVHDIPSLLDVLE